jgi:hypothetical protein
LIAADILEGKKGIPPFTVVSIQPRQASGLKAETSTWSGSQWWLRRSRKGKGCKIYATSERKYHRKMQWI